MTRRNNKRNNRHNRQRNNETEFSPFASMLFGALLGKGTEMIAEKMAEEAKKTPDIHTEGISNKDINNGNATLSKLRIPADGSAVEYPIPDNLQFFFAEDGKLMVRKKIEGDAEAPDDKEGKPITYDEVIKELYYGKTAYWVGSTRISYAITNENSYNNINNCASEAQCKRMVAFNKLQNIAKYLNKGWKPNFCIGDKKWGIIKEEEGFSPKYIRMINDANIYFRDKDLANEAIRLMGEESLNDLFSTDW